MLTLLTVVIASSLFFVRCNRGEDELPMHLPQGVSAKDIIIGPNTANSAIELDDVLKLEDGTQLPAGTVISKDPNNPYSFNFELPEGYKVMGRDPASGRTAIGFAGALTCSCTSGTGCSPYVATIGGKKYSGCVMGSNCTSCQQKTSGTLSDPGGRKAVMLENAEIVNFNENITFLTSREELANTSSPSSQFIESPEIQKELQAFIAGYQKHDLAAVHKARDYNELPENYVLIAFNVYGRVLFAPVDETITLSANPILNDFVIDPSSSDEAGRTSIGFATKYSCKCSSGTSGCTLKTKSVPLVGSVVYCDAGLCKTCTLESN